LENATQLRELIKRDDQEILFDTRPFKDIYRISAVKLEDGIRYAYDKYGTENSTIICRSNWQAVQYNQMVRRNILFYDEELDAGDIIMAVKNNYFYLEADSDAGFIANGDFMEVKKIVDFEDRYGLRFATLMVTLIDYPQIPAFDVKVILDTLYSNSPALSQEDHKKLYNEISAEVMKEKGKKNYKSALQNHEYLNALQIKFAYALTCHKSQGGQWNIVFLDQGVRGDTEIDNDYTKWLYTAVTRATNELYLVNFEDRFFKK
jgi:exodeoxyribonuclease-5